MLDLSDLDLVGAGLRKTFPALESITPMHVLGSGFNSVALETAEGLVFRIGKNDFATPGYRKEAHILPIIAAQITTPIPNPQWYAPTSPDFPFGVIGYRKLHGTPLNPASLTSANQPSLIRSLARFMLSLHTVSLIAIADLSRTNISDYATLRDAVLPTLRSLLTAPEYAAIAHWWDVFLADAALRTYQPALCHGDLWYENILVDSASQSVAGILDFESMTIFDPALDFVALLYLGDDFVSQVIHAYRDAGGLLGDTFLRRLNLLWGLREFGGVHYSVQLNDAEELADSVAKIRRGPILTPREFRL